MSDDHLSKILANFQQQVCTEFEIQRQFILSKNEELDKREKELQKNFNHLNMVWFVFESFCFNLSHAKCKIL